MPDKASNDRNLINIHLRGSKEYEIRFIAAKFGILREIVRKAAAEVGNNRELIEERLKKIIP